MWYTVRVWAEENSYRFANMGREGDDGVIGDEPAVPKNEPVNYINWRDAMVWCNALTEYYNTKNDTIYECVYKKNNGEVIRSSTDANADVCDSVVPDTEADGFRLLSVDEWELAARYKDDGDIKDKGEYYPGNFASGANADYNDSTACGIVSWFNSNSNSHSHDIKQKVGNALGLFDVSGNVV